MEITHSAALEADFDTFTQELRHNRLPSTTQLNTGQWSLNFETGTALLSLDAQGIARWQNFPLPATLSQGESASPCDVVEAAEQLFFIDLPLPATWKQSLILILDTHFRQAVLVHTRQDTHRKAAGLASNIEQHFFTAQMAGAKPDTLPTESRELLGKRVLNIYSEDTAVEHIYLNSQWYAYHIHGGVRHGDCDCDEATYIKLRENLYLVAFREKAIDVGIIFALDTQRWHNTGMAVGETDPDSGWFSVPIGAKMQLLSETHYPAPFSPR